MVELTEDFKSLIFQIIQRFLDFVKEIINKKTLSTENLLRILDELAKL